jgi:hypothetical protein
VVQEEVVQEEEGKKKLKLIFQTGIVILVIRALNPFKAKV